MSTALCARTPAVTNMMPSLIFVHASCACHNLPCSAWRAAGLRDRGKDVNNLVSRLKQGGWQCTGQQQGPIAGGAHRNVPLCICGPDAGGVYQPFQADADGGLVSVPLNSDAYGIYRYIQVGHLPQDTEG